jgi:flagellar motor switch protein FliN/FliY
MEETTEAVEEKTEETQGQEDSTTQAQAVEFSEVSATGDAGIDGSIDILLDVNVSVTVALGQAEIPVRRLLQLGPGSVLGLDKPIDAPADLYVGDTKFAMGTVVNKFLVSVILLPKPPGHECKLEGTPLRGNQL